MLKGRESGGLKSEVGSLRTKVTQLFVRGCCVKRSGIRLQTSVFLIFTTASFIWTNNIIDTWIQQEL